MPVSSRVQELESEKTEFKKGLGLFDSTMMVSGCMIGSGVFIVISSMLQAPDPAKGVWGVPYPGLMILVWIAGGLITLLGALSYAELAGSMPKAGGPYVYLRESFGRFVAFLYGWAFFFCIQSGFLAGVSVAFGRVGFSLFSHQALGDVTGELWPVRILAVLSIIFLTGWNIMGIRMGAILQNIFTVLKIGAILALIALAFMHPAAADPTPFFPPVFTKNLMVGFGVAIIGVFFAYDCWYMVMFAGEEVRDAKRTFPRALILGTSLVTLLYCLANWSYIHVLTVQQIQHLHDIKGVAGIEAVRTMAGLGGALLITIAILISIFGALNGITLTGARAFYAMAKDGLFLKPAGDLHPRYKTPVFALAAQAVWAIFLILLPGQTYDKLFTYVEFASFLFFAVTIVGLFRLRKIYPELHRPFKAPSLIPIVYLILALAFLVNTVITQPSNSGYGLLIIAIGAIVYAVIKGRSPRIAGEVVSE